MAELCWGMRAVPAPKNVWGGMWGQQALLWMGCQGEEMGLVESGVPRAPWGHRVGSQGGLAGCSEGPGGHSLTAQPTVPPQSHPRGSWPALLGGLRSVQSSQGWAEGEGAGAGPLRRPTLLLNLTYSLPYMLQCP